MALKILLNGANGRMGQAVREAAEASGHVIACALDLGDDVGTALETSDVAIDFSSHDATLPLARAARAAGKALVIGTTGHTPEEKEAIRREAERIPTVWAGNFSVGVNLLFYLTSRTASILGADFNPEVVEMHHRFKKDAPSGTAERLVEILREAYALSEENVRHGRKGLTGERPPTEIGVHALRGGDVVGDHTVCFAGDGERIELTHRASNRSIFARGAVRAAAWAIAQPPGIYSMQDVLGLKE